MEPSEEASLVDQCHSALADVTDPELPISIVDLGLVYGISIDDGHAEVDMTLTAMGCPAAGLMTEEVKEELLQIDGVDSVDVEIVWSPPWTTDKMSDEGKQQLRSLGIAV